jgi:hypothetical protein
MMERGQYRFTVKENARGEFWLAAEPAGDTIMRAKVQTESTQRHGGGVHGVPAMQQASTAGAVHVQFAEKKLGQIK